MFISKRKFITKIMFISKHFNYNIHFLNIVSVRWRPCQHIPPSVSGSSTSLVAAWWEKSLPLLPWCSVSNPLSLVCFRTPCSWDNLRGRSIATRDTRSDEYWIANEISSESRQNRCFLKYVSTAKTRCSTDQRSMATEMLWATLEEHSRTNSPRQRFHSQFFLLNHQAFLPDPVYLFCRTYTAIYCLVTNDC